MSYYPCTGGCSTILSHPGHCKACIQRIVEKVGLPNSVFKYSVPPADTSNPKDSAGRAKLPLALLSPVAKAAWCLAQYAGKVKYGAWNWRGTEVRASVYVSAAMRHLDKWLSGETFDADDGTHHLGNVMACCAILLDAMAAGKLIDDRPPVVDLAGIHKDAQAVTSSIDAKYAGMDPPKHWTIEDKI